MGAMVVLLAVAALLYGAVSWLLGAALAGPLISSRGLAAGEDRRQALLAAMRLRASEVVGFEYRGSAKDPVTLHATFASPGDPASRATILFLHGKGGNASEWEPDAVRALTEGYNVLIPDLRAHGLSGGRFITYGYLEKEDLGNALAAAAERFGLDHGRLGVHSCSAGSAVALQFASGNAEVKALWLESPFAEPRAMARRYLNRMTRLPEWLLDPAARVAFRRALARLRRELGGRGGEGVESADPIAAAKGIRAAVLLVYGSRDLLIPPRLVRRLRDALPAGTEVWEVRQAGHCHHDDEAEKVDPGQYEARWIRFFEAHLRV
jgi:uncharacterized protein